jgi:gamma-glutamyl-gamma-aminobutyrate hydrolase PuuD
MAKTRVIAVSQRVDTVPGRSERRDALDQRWHEFFGGCGFLGVPIPNSSDAVSDILTEINPIGVLLTGGNDIAAYGGDAPERDETEHAMLSWAIDRNRPAVGVCRGLQMIAHINGAVLKPISGHVGVRHRLQWEGRDIEVNSFHNWGFDVAPSGFDVTARSDDGFIEAVRHHSKPIVGIMWHPEREPVFAVHDTALFRDMFGRA